MSAIEEFDQRLERIISDFALRIIVPRWSEFDGVLEASIRVCDRYQLGQRQIDERFHCVRHGFRTDNHKGNDAARRKD
jgi:hypothetical protein